MSETVPGREERAYDVVVFGATGFTGRLVAEYLAEQYGDQVRWAMAGRNRGKLEQVRSEIAQRFPVARDVPLLVADSEERASLDAVARSTRAVATTVGPYLRYGLNLAAACAENGTDYCDLTGEVPFIRTIIDRHAEVAKRTGARLVPCCGFDSIPSDLGVFLLAEAARAKGLRLGQTRLIVRSMKGGLSGGTLASMMNLMELASHDRGLRRLMADPYALDPKDSARGADGREQMGVRYDADVDRWTGPFVMAAVNVRVVRRSNALQGGAYGPHFRYDESLALGKGPIGAVTAAGVTGGLGALVGLMTTKPGRAFLSKVLPSPGEGPSREKRERGSFRIQIVSHTEREDGSAGPVLKGRVGMDRDPGYSGTARMLAESALCLAKGEAASREGGVLTTATGMGRPLIERLRRAGMTFELEA